MKKVALITGMTGRDVTYFVRFLLEKGYEGYGIKRRASLFNIDRIGDIYEGAHVESKRFFFHYGEFSNSSNLIRIIQKMQPDEVYNLAAQSHVAVSFESLEYIADVTKLGALRLLEAIRIVGLEKKTKIYQAVTSELFGLMQEVPQTEKTSFYPRPPYAYQVI